MDSTFPITETCGNRARGDSRPPDGEAIRLLCVDGEGEGRGLADRLMRADDRFEVVTDRSASRALAILAGEPPDQRRRSSCATPGTGAGPDERPADLHGWPQFAPRAGHETGLVSPDTGRRSFHISN